MQGPIPPVVEAALLYDEYKAFDYAGFAKFLQKVFKESLQVRLGVHQDRAFGLLVAGSSYILISQNKEPLASDGFQNALNSEYMKIHYPEGEEVVQSHRKNIFVTVGSKDITLTPDIQEMISKVSPDLKVPKSPPPNQKQFETHWLMAQIVTHLLCIVNQPRLIHWCQSDRFIRPDEWAKAVKNRSGWPFQVHPVLLNTQQMDDQGRHKIGIALHGSEHFTGHHMVVEETIYSFERVIDEIIFEMMSMLHGQKELPQSGSKITFKSGAATRLHVRPAGEVHPRPYVSLEILSLADQPHLEDMNPYSGLGASAHVPQEPDTPEPHQDMIASPVHPNAPQQSGYSGGDAPKKPAKKSALTPRNIAALALVMALYLVLYSADKFFRGNSDSIVEASVNLPEETIEETIEVQPEEEEAVTFVTPKSIHLLNYCPQWVPRLFGEYL